MQTSLSKINDYPRFLNEAWNCHLAPKSEDAPTVISTFAGAGGSTLGYSMAGFNELLAVELDKNAAETFRMNFPEIDLYHGDITELTVEEILARTKLQPGDLDVFDGSPPCQGFSNAGKRVFDDERNFLFRHYVRILKGLMPKIFVMENVSGMVKGKMKLIFAEIMRELKTCGYSVKAVLMNAKYFGVPQSRERLIFIGTRFDLEKMPTFPKAKYLPISFREATAGVETVGEPLRGKLGEIGRFARRGETFDKAVKRSGERKHKHFSTLKMTWDRVCPTVCKTMKPHMAGIVHPDANNMISLDALKRCGSFPDEFKFFGTTEDVWARIGNSVPPLLMKAIAENIRKIL